MVGRRISISNLSLESSMTLSPQQEAIRIAREYLERKPIYLDTETTGTGPNDTILEIAIVDHDGQVLIDTLVKPVGKIHPDAQRVHGIDPTLVLDAPPWQEVWLAVEGILRGRLVGIYNADFDLRLIQQSHALSWLNWQTPDGMQAFCLMKLYAQFVGQWDPRRGSYRWHSLDAAGKQCRIPLRNSHRAKEDALLTRALLKHMAK